MSNTNNSMSFSDVSDTFDSGTFLSDVVAHLDDDNKNYTNFNNGQQIRVSVFFVPKFASVKEMKDAKNSIFLEYGNTVSNIVINDLLGQFGLTGNMEISNDGGMYDYVLQRFNCFYLVISFTVKDGQGSSIKYEPYIFDVVSVMNLSSDNPQNVRVQINFCDLYRSIASQHSIGSVIKNDPQITRYSSYKDVFASILSFMRKFIKSNYEGKMEISKTTRFMHENSDFSSLVQASFRKINQNDTILDALNVLMKDAAHGVITPEDFLQNSSSIGDVCVPFFFREEYPDANNIYRKICETQTDDNGLPLVDASYQGSDGIFRRDFFLRDIFMPFALAFSQKDSIIFESINPHVDDTGNLADDENQFQCMNGRHQTEISNFTSQNINMEHIKKKWKNIIFVSTGADNNSSCLVYFNWIYNYFRDVFMGGKFALNVMPDFYAKLCREGVSLDYKEAFEEANAYVKALQSEDPVTEALVEIGKNVASFVLLNTSYSFNMRGNLLFRPNEIIKLNKNKKDDSNQETSFTTDMSNSDYVLLYVSNVTHIFNGKSYTNRVMCNKIYEITK